MGKLLGFGMCDYPAMSMTDAKMSRPIQTTLQSERITAEARNEENWPEEMRREWGTDMGAQTAKEARENALEHIGKVRTALDEFSPDATIIIAKDHCETVERSAMYLPYWICAFDNVTVKPFQEGNCFGESPETEVLVPGAREIGLQLSNGLRDEGFSPAVLNSPSSPAGLAHTYRSAVVLLDWDKRERTFPHRMLPMPFNPFGDRGRDTTGLEPLKPNHWLPATMPAGFELGRAIARVVRASDKRIALGVATGWSHANDTSWDHGWLAPDIEADRQLFAQWKSGNLDRFGEITATELEEHGWWELWGWAVLAGAMKESGAKMAHADLQDHWIFNSTWVTTIFDEA